MKRNSSKEEQETYLHVKQEMQKIMYCTITTNRIKNTRVELHTVDLVHYH